MKNLRGVLDPILTVVAARTARTALVVLALSACVQPPPSPVGQSGDALVAQCEIVSPPAGATVGAADDLDQNQPGIQVDVQKKPYGLFQQAHVLPAVDFTKLDEVIVLALPPEETPPPPDSPAALVASRGAAGAKAAEPRVSPAQREAIPASSTIQGASVVPAVAPLREGAAP